MASYSPSGRLTRPARTLGRFVRRRAPGGDRPGRPIDPWLSPERLDGWLAGFHSPTLDALERECAARAGPTRFELFRELDLDLWALLLTKQYKLYPHIRSLLPDMPGADIQELWNGCSGAALAAQGAAFYRKLCERYRTYGHSPLHRASILDYGCGWGRLTRFLARDVTPGDLYGCEPVAGMVEFCRRSGLAATVEQIDVLPASPPFDRRFDLAFAFSVFTHLSEEAHQRALTVLHEALAPDGVLLVTIRPPAYMTVSPLLHPLLEQLGSDPRSAWEQPQFLHVAHPADQHHPQYTGGRMHYGETVITLPYVHQRWSDRFELLQVDLLAEDLHQVVLTLRRR